MAGKSRTKEREFTLLALFGLSSAGGVMVFLGFWLQNAVWFGAGMAAYVACGVVVRSVLGRRGLPSTPNRAS